jgi:hypothetical protein
MPSDREVASLKMRASYSVILLVALKMTEPHTELVLHPEIGGQFQHRNPGSGLSCRSAGSRRAR